MPVQPMQYYQLKFWVFKTDDGEYLHLKRFTDKYNWYWTDNLQQASTFTESECNQFLDEIAATDPMIAEGLKLMCHRISKINQKKTGYHNDNQSLILS